MLKIMSIPRYHGFTVETPKLAEKNVQFVDIAGNKTILLTVVVPAEWKPPQGIDIFYEWPVLTDSTLKRSALLLPVSKLSSFLNDEAKDTAVVLDHIFDY